MRSSADMASLSLITYVDFFQYVQQLADSRIFALVWLSGMAGNQRGPADGSCARQSIKTRWRSGFDFTCCAALLYRKMAWRFRPGHLRVRRTDVAACARKSSCGSFGTSYCARADQVLRTCRGAGAPVHPKTSGIGSHRAQAASIGLASSREVWPERVGNCRD